MSSKVRNSENCCLSRSCGSHNAIRSDLCFSVFFLIDLFSYSGFTKTKKVATGEIMLEKPILSNALPAVTEDAFDFDRRHYPRFSDGATVRKFCVPIQPDYHRRLFPEIAFVAEIPSNSSFRSGAYVRRGAPAGNTIRKVYLCRAKNTRIRAGDVLLFYMSKDQRYAASQSMTTVGIAEQLIHVTAADDLIRLTAKRSVYSAEDMIAMNASPDSPVKMIDFLLVGHSQPPAKLDILLTERVFSNRPPQSIAELAETQYRALKPLLRLGFDL